MREGCLLRIATSSSWKAVPFEGKEQDVELDKKALTFAETAAHAFGVQQFSKPFIFNRKQADKWLNLKKDERDKRRRQGPVVKQDL